MTISPEIDGAEEIIRYAVSKGITVALGHSNADYETTVKAIAAGATQSTHTFNAARSFHHREPGIVGAVLTDPNVYCENDLRLCTSPSCNSQADLYDQRIGADNHGQRFHNCYRNGYERICSKTVLHGMLLTVRVEGQTERFWAA